MLAGILLRIAPRGSSHFFKLEAIPRLSIHQRSTLWLHLMFLRAATVNPCHRRPVVPTCSHQLPTLGRHVSPGDVKYLQRTDQRTSSDMTIVRVPRGASGAGHDFRASMYLRVHCSRVRALTIGSRWLVGIRITWRRTDSMELTHELSAMCVLQWVVWGLGLRLSYEKPDKLPCLSVNSLTH